MVSKNSVHMNQDVRLVFT